MRGAHRTGRAGPALGRRGRRLPAGPRCAPPGRWPHGTPRAHHDGGAAPGRGAGAGWRGRAGRRRPPRAVGGGPRRRASSSSTSQSETPDRVLGPGAGGPHRGPLQGQRGGHVGQQPDPVVGDHRDPGAVVAGSTVSARPWRRRPREATGSSGSAILGATAPAAGPERRQRPLGPTT